MSYKLQHWLVKVKYLPGEDNGLADALSRERGATTRTRRDDNRTSTDAGCQSRLGACGGTNPHMKIACVGNTGKGSTQANITNNELVSACVVRVLNLY